MIRDMHETNRLLDERDEQLREQWEQEKAFLDKCDALLEAGDLFGFAVALSVEKAKQHTRDREE